MASRKLSLINQDYAPVQMSLLDLPGTQKRGLEDDIFPKIVRDAAGFKEVLRRAEKLGLLGLDYEFKSYDRPTVMGIAVRDLACGIPFDRTLHRYIADAARSGIKLVAHSGFGADLPVFAAVEGFDPPYDWMICSMIVHWFENSHLTKAPSKDESDDAGALGFMNLWSATSLTTDVPNWKECLHRSTKVQLGDGSWEAISSLVKRKYSGDVKALDENGRFVNAAVRGWFTNERRDRKFYRISHKNHRTAGSGKPRVIVTGDHKVLTPQGWKCAEDLVSGVDRIITSSPAPDPKNMGFLVGMALGDSHREAKTGRFRIFNRYQSKDYVNAKCLVLKNFDRHYYEEPAQKETHSVLSHVIFSASPFWREFATYSYDRLLVDFDLNSLAIWYMDDGYRSVWGISEISCHSLSPEVLSLFVSKINSLGISCHIRQSASMEGPIIQFDRESTKQLSSRIGHLVPPSLRYKLEPGSPEFDLSSYSTSAYYAYADVVEVEEYQDNSDTVYCISVEKYENFVTRTAVVSNCRGSACHGPCPRCDVFGYCAVDSWGGLESFIVNRERLRKRGFMWETYERRAQLAYHLEKMQQQGVRLDREFVKRFDANSEKLKAALFPENENGVCSPFNPRSSDQVLAWAVANKVSLKSNQKNDVRKALELLAARHGFLSIDELDQAEELPEALSVLYRLDQYKGEGKGSDAWLSDKYIDKDNLMHPRFIYVGTSTGRLSSSKPNAQNWPSRGWGALIKAAIVPHDPDFDIIDADLGQLELRDVLYQAGFDIRSIKGDALQFIVEQGGDRFDRAAQIAGGEARDIVKTVVYGGQYGEGLQIYTVADLMRPTTQREIAAGAIRLYTPQYVPWLTKAWEYGGGIVGFTGANLAERLFGDKSWESRKKALEIQDDLIFGGDLRIIREWQIKTLEEIESKGYVDLPNTQFLRLNGSPRDNAKVGLAFKGQGLGAVHAQATMLACIRENKTLPLLQVHDSLVYAVNRSWSDRKVREFIAPMFGETDVLPGFKAPGKVKRGRNYGGFDEKLNPGGLKLIWNSAKENVDGSRV